MRCSVFSIATPSRFLLSVTAAAAFFLSMPAPASEVKLTPEQQVEIVHPDWRQTVRTAAFRRWLNQQPQSIKDLSASEAPIDAIRLLDLFVRDGAALAASPRSPSEIFKRNSSAVVKIETGSGRGSGVVFIEDFQEPKARYIVTNEHVVRSEAVVDVVLGDARDRADVLYVDADLDIAVLRGARRLPLRNADFKDAEEPEVGEEVVAIGSPKGLENTLTTGVISGHRHFQGIRWIQTSAAISPGSSGGGLFNRAGALVGITTSKRIDAEGIAFALPTIYVRHVARSAFAYGLLNEMTAKAHLTRIGEIRNTQRTIEAIAWKRGSSAANNYLYVEIFDIYQKFKSEGSASIKPDLERILSELKAAP